MTTFQHEKLKVYQDALQFIELTNKIVGKLNGREPIKDQLERASSSISLNIAEGNGRYTSKDRCRFLDNARGSALECAACLDVLLAKGKITESEVDSAKAVLSQIVGRIFALIRAISKDREY